MRPIALPLFFRHRCRAAGRGRLLLAGLCWLLGWAGLRAAAVARPLPDLPEPLTNNAVAAVCHGGHRLVLSVYGLESGRRAADITRRVLLLDLDAPAPIWERLPDAPMRPPRLAASAVGLAGRAYVLGGYSVAPDDSETTHGDLWSFDPADRQWKRLADMPLAVDDSVALAWRDRWIYLVSGWHRNGNVATVQLYDTRTDRWQRLADFPGTPVFGHAGGIASGRIVIIDGVAVVGRDERGRRRFRLISQAWEGRIDPADPARITWRRLPDHPGPPVYRAAAAGSRLADLVLFAGGGLRAYNYDGIAYEGGPVRPSARVFGFDLRAGRWVRLGRLPEASMDHRGLLLAGSRAIVAGGMRTGPAVTARVA
ncbi:MAG: galactose oxidase, partial [Alphaproteobacteria bacterium]